MGFFLDFLTGLVGVAGRGSCGDGVGDGLVGVSDGVPGSGAGNEGGLIEIFKEGGDVMASFSSATDTLGGDFIKQFPRFFGLPLLRFWPRGTALSCEVTSMIPSMKHMPTVCLQSLPFIPTGQSQKN